MDEARKADEQSEARTPPPNHSGAERRWFPIPLAAALIYIGATIHAARVETPTVDEFAHVPAGCAYWKYGRLDLYSKNPPLLKYWLALPIVLDSSVEVPEPTEEPFGWGPWKYGTRFMEANRDRYLGLFFRARAMVIVLGLATALVLYGWARELFGDFAASIVAALFLLSPNILAHGHLATVDVGCMFSVLVSVFGFRWAYKKRSWMRFSLAGVLLGLALLIKFTAVLLIPIFVILSLVYHRGIGRSFRWFLFPRLAGDLVVVFTIALLTINFGFGFKKSFERLDEYSFGSAFFTRVQESLPGGLRVPLPRDYLAGLDAQKRDTERGEAGSYMMGRWSRQGWWYYFFVAFGVKVPVPFLLALPIGAGFWFVRRPGWTETSTVFVPVVVFLFVMCVFNRLNIGIRYLLVIFPFLFLAAAPLFERIAQATRHRWTKALPAGMLLYYCAVIWSIHPSYLSFFNVIAGGPDRGSYWLLDSNLDWGQDLYRLPEAVRRRNPHGPIRLLYFGHVDPGIYGLDFLVVPPMLVRNLVAVSVNYLKGYPYSIRTPGGSYFLAEPDSLEWLREREPVERLGSILLFDTRHRGDRE